MVADIDHRYIFLREQKGARWNIKRSARLIANPLTPIPLRHRRSQPPSDLWSILYIRYFLLSIAPICLIYVSFRDHPRSPSAVPPALAWPPSTPPPPPPPGQAPRPLSCEIHPLRIRKVRTGHWIFPRICSRCKRAAILKRYISERSRRRKLNRRGFNVVVYE